MSDDEEYEEFDSGLTEEELEELREQSREQDVIDNRIRFFLELLLNDYEADDIARVASELESDYEAQFLCQDCEVSVMDKHEFFLVHPELEEQVGLEDGRLCVECFEKRLGRELIAFDFLNSMVELGKLDHSDLLRKRLISGLEETLPEE